MNKRALIINSIGLAVLVIVTQFVTVKICEKKFTTVNNSAQIDSLATVALEYKQTIEDYEIKFKDLTLQDSISVVQIDSLKILTDSLATDNFIYKYKLGRIQNYINIVNNNSTQSKYLKGWITRVLNE